jgi:hypothetical protein
MALRDFGRTIRLRRTAEPDEEAARRESRPPLIVIPPRGRLTTARERDRSAAQSSLTSRQSASSATSDQRLNQLLGAVAVRFTKPVGPLDCGSVHKHGRP